eukprot:COSAG04_NODE_283_length_18154_cov_432.957020_3_plen_137_part_00
MADTARVLLPATVAIGTDLSTNSANWQSAVCDGHEMTAGVHCAHFELRGNTAARTRRAMVGVVGPSFNPTTTGVYRRDVAHMSAEGWVMHTGRGTLYQSGSYSNWAGQPEENELKDGDVVVRPPPCATPCLPCCVR